MKTQEIAEQYLPTYKENFKTDSRWISRESKHYIFNYFSNSIAEKEIDLIEKIQEDAFSKIVKFLDIPEPVQKTKYYLYPSGIIKEELMGDDWYAQAIRKDFAVHTLYTDKYKIIGAHEDTHLLAMSLGVPIGFLGEGLAEYMQGKNLFGQDYDDVSREGFEKKVMPTVTDLMDHKKWANFPNEHIAYYYGIAGSFTKFIVNNFGKDKFKQLYQNTKRTNTREENIAVFENIYKILPEEMESKWKKRLFPTRCFKSFQFIKSH